MLQVLGHFQNVFDHFVTFWLFEMATSKGHMGLSQNRKRRVIGDDHADEGQQGGRRASSLITM
jgi:hypothetical protein